MSMGAMQQRAVTARSMQVTMMRMCAPLASSKRLVGRRPRLSMGRTCRLQVTAFQGNEAAAAPGTGTSPPSATRSAIALTQQFEAASAQGNVYGKPLTANETTALQAACAKFKPELANAGSPGGITKLRSHLLAYLRDAARTKAAPLPVVEGAMLMLEMLHLMDARERGVDPTGAMSETDMLCRWQLVIGADVGSIQYIPVVEELQVTRGGGPFALDTDLDWVFTGFSGNAHWLSPGHLSYKVERVRIELRQPKAWGRAAVWYRWRVQQGAEGKEHYNEGAAEPDYGRFAPDANTCHPDPSRGALTVPLPFFPENQLFIYASDGDTAALRSKLGGVILLVNKTPVSERVWKKSMEDSDA